MHDTWSTTYPNGSAKHAWRAGFREGVKMALDRGVKVTVEEFHKNHWKNLHRLYIWLMVGADVDHGEWAIYGAREGLYKTMCSDWDYVQVRDFDYLNNLWNESVSTITEENLEKETEVLGDKLIQHLDIPISVSPLNGSQSKFFKEVYQNPTRLDEIIDIEE